MKTRNCLAALSLVVLSACASAPRAVRVETPTAADPTPGFLRQYAQTNRFRSGHPSGFAITPDGATVYYLRSGPRDRVQSLYAFDTASKSERVFLTAEGLLGAGEETLSAEEKARRERARQSARGIAMFELSKDGAKVLVPLSGRLFVVSSSDGGVRELKASVEGASAGLDPRFSPDGSKVAFVRDGDLWVAEVASGEERQITTGASGTLTHGDAEFVAQEEMGRSKGYWWSPDSKSIAYQTTDASMVEEVYIADPLRPFVKPQSWRYPRAGTNNAVVTLSVVSVEQGAAGGARALEWDREGFPYLATVKWEQQRWLYAVVQNRLQTENRLLRFDVGSGQSQLILTETDPAWVNLDQEMPALSDRMPGFLWTTEGAGWTDLEWRMEGPEASAKRLVVGGDLNFRSLVKVDPARRETLVLAGPDPTQTHLYSVEHRRGEVTPACLTCDWPGVHGAKVSEDGSTIVLTTRPQNGDQVSCVFRRQAGERGLGTPLADIRSDAEAALSKPRTEWTGVTSREGVSWHAAILRPSAFKKGQKFPVICSVYTGPTAQTVTRVNSQYALQQWVADHGFIVVSIDNRGTPGRGRDWERLTHGNLIDLQLNDQTAALNLLGEKYPELDLSRVGVYGWSFGGYYSAMAACRRPDVYKAACAGAPVTDWADYDTHYTERYLGLPKQNAEGYRVGNVMTWAKDLRVPLLLIHGTADDNVYFTHSLKLMDEAVRQGTSEWIDFMPLAGQTHMVVEPEVVERMYARMMAFFAEHLRGAAGGTASR